METKNNCCDYWNSSEPGGISSLALALVVALGVGGIIVKCFSKADKTPNFAEGVSVIDSSYEVPQKVFRCYKDGKEVHLSRYFPEPGSVEYYSSFAELIQSCDSCKDVVYGRSLDSVSLKKE